MVPSGLRSNYRFCEARHLWGERYRDRFVHFFRNVRWSTFRPQLCSFSPYQTLRHPRVRFNHLAFVCFNPGWKSWWIFGGYCQRSVQPSYLFAEFPEAHLPGWHTTIYLPDGVVTPLGLTDHARITMGWADQNDRRQFAARSMKLAKGTKPIYVLSTDLIRMGPLSCRA